MQNANVAVPLASMVM